MVQRERIGAPAGFASLGYSYVPELGLFFGSAHRLQASGNAVELLGTYEDRSSVYIVMEECRGGDLETLLEVRLPEFACRV